MVIIVADVSVNVGVTVRLDVTLVISLHESKTKSDVLVVLVGESVGAVASEPYSTVSVQKTSPNASRNVTVY